MTTTPVLLREKFHGQRSLRLQSVGSQRVRHDWVNAWECVHTHTHTHTQCAKHCILSIIPSSQQKERYPQYLGGDTEAQRSCQKPTVISSDTQVPVSNCCSKGPWKAESSALRVSVTGKKRQLARRKGSDAETSRALIPWERAHTLTTATKTG